MLKKWLSIAVIVVILDQITKLMASAWLEFERIEPVAPFLNFILMHNPGAAFSFLSDAGGWQRWLFSLIALAVSIFLVAWLRRLPAHEWLSGWGLALILGGAVGNLIDRVWYGYVIDFVQVYYPAQSCVWGFAATLFQDKLVCVWPTFNIADAAISIGAVVLIIDTLRAYRRKPTAV